ncbi:MAG: glucuronate isomerase [Anaerolineales bacterium]|nr:glucuronate isomerase [Anaerolineales bacterium]
MTAASPALLAPDRFFGPDQRQQQVAAELYGLVKDLPLVCPHGHVDPRLLAEPDYQFGTPVDLLLLPDHYIFRMLYSQGLALERLGIARRDGGPVETDHRAIWQLFADHFYLFRGTPTGVWLADVLYNLFELPARLSGATAQRSYDHLAERLRSPAFRPRALFERFNIEVLCTTDAATDPLASHQAIRASGWGGRVIPCFRPDAVIALDAPGWREHLERLAELSGVAIGGYAAFIQALEIRRAFFKTQGAVAADHAALSADTEGLTAAAADRLFQRALRGQANAADAARFTAHMLGESARMSVDDGLVMQLHAHALRNHHWAVYETFGADKGADIPVRGEFTRALRPLLKRFGADPRLRLILFTLDESTYARELAPLAGHYPAVRLGPPWWFHDSLNGLARYFDQVMETAGLYNTAGFNDDTRAFCSIPARHDLWRRAASNWLAGLLLRGVISRPDAEAMSVDLAYHLARRAYRLEPTAARAQIGSDHA